MTSMISTVFSLSGIHAHCITKAMPIHFINGKCHIKKLIRKSPKTCLTNLIGSISHHIMLLIIIALRADPHRGTQAHILTSQTKAISKNQVHG